MSDEDVEPAVQGHATNGNDAVMNGDGGDGVGNVAAADGAVGGNIGGIGEVGNDARGLDLFGPQGQWGQFLGSSGGQQTQGQRDTRTREPTPAALVGHALVRVDELERLHEEVKSSVEARLSASEGKLAAAEQLMTVYTERKFAELEGRFTALVASADATFTALAAKAEVQFRTSEASVIRAEQQMQSLQADNQTLRARVSELERQPKSAGGSTRPATLAELLERRTALTQIRDAGLSCGIARAAGYACAEAYEAGYTLLEAKTAGWSTEELRMAGYIDHRGMSSREFFDKCQAGCRNFAGLDFSGESFGGMVIDNACNMSRCRFVQASFDHAALTGVDFTSCDLSGADLSNATLKNCDLTDATLPAKAKWAQTKICGEAGAWPMRAHGFSCAEVKAMGMMQGLKKAGYSCTEAKQAGYSCAEVKQAGYSCAEAKQAGYLSQDAKAAGYGPEEAFRAGYSKEDTSRDKDGAAPWQWNV